MRKLEKISFEQFCKDIKDDIELYNSYSLPERKTKNSAGYDFYSIIDFVLKPNETIKVPLGIKVCMNEDEFFGLYVRSSLGFKYNVRLCNQVGIIDSDYYNNIDNEGHMWVKLENHGDNDFIVKKGDRLVQGIFQKYYTVDDEKEIKEERISGLGSTNKSN